jgi:glyoxylase-like metal-dependent hydrolase (beta-lactamase superfamily II)
MEISGIRVDTVTDGTGYAPPDVVLNKQLDAWRVHPEFLEPQDQMMIEFSTFLLRTAGRTILVDAGVGPTAPAGSGIGVLPASLRAVGVRPEEVTDVVFTHLHFDHSGWVSTDGMPTFPNAEHYCHALEWEHFCGSDPCDEVLDMGAVPAPERFASVAHRMTLLDAAETAIAPGVMVRLAPGHTPGSTLVRVGGGEETLYLLGDIAHSPIEFLDDDWACLFDFDASAATNTRNALALELIETGALVMATHWRPNRRLRLTSDGSERRWVED